MHSEKNYLREEGLDRFIDLTIEFSASTGKEYCESTGKCNSTVKLYIPQRAEIWIIQRSHLAPQRAKNTPRGIL